jgi:membrane protein implicated in regulation of membrane protease activity
MDFSPATVWWLLAAVLVALELATGTLYLLMLAGGAAVGAIAAHMGMGSTAQIVAAALVATVATLTWHRMRARDAANGVDAMANRDVQLDVGERITVAKWNEDKTARAVYRGTEWLVRYAGDDVPAPGEHRIVALEGNRLILKK